MKTIKNLTADQIRKSILQLAIQGKLVKQDPNDEPASELVKRIYEEKQRLIKEGKLKKDKNESYIYKGDDNCYYEKIGKEVKNITSELPFEIPDNWTWIRLSNYCYLNGGYAFKSNNFSNEGIRVIRISDFDENGIKSKEIKRYPYSNEMDKSKIEVNDIIVCMTGGTVGKSLYIKQLEEPSYLNQRVALIRTKDKLSDYLANVFKSPYIQELVKDNITSTNDNISMNFLNNILIPIPPFNEQLRIQSKLLYCEPLIKNYEYLERQLTQLESNFEERLKASILQYAIEGKLVKQNPNDEPASVLLERIKAEKEKLISEGKIKRDKNDSIIEQSDDKNYYRKYLKSSEVIPLEITLFNIPSSWRWATLGEISKQISDGTHKTPKYVTSGIPFLSIANISSEKYDGKPKYITLEEHEQLIKRCKPELDDILLCRIGTLGKPFINKLNFEFSIFVSLGLIKLIDKTSVQFIKLVLESPLSYKFIEKVKVGGGTHTFKINIEDIYGFPIPIPPFKEQTRIIDRLMRINVLLS